MAVEPRVGVGPAEEAFTVGRRSSWAAYAERLQRERRPWIVGLAVVIAAAALFYWFEGRNLTFYADEWGFLLYRHGTDVDGLASPAGGHLILVPLLVYKALFAIFGATSYGPFRMVSIAASLTCGCLFFELARRRVGDAVAFFPTVVLVFLGTAWEELLSGIGLIVFISLAAGLGMLLALEARTLRGDLLACGLLAVSLASFSYGLPFAVAAAVDIALRPGARRRAWVFLVPLALYGVWSLGYGDSQLIKSNVPGALRSIAESLASVSVSLTGLYRPTIHKGPNFDLTWGPPLALLLITFTAMRLRRPVSDPARLWALIALALAFWLSIALVENTGRTPKSSRYQYPGAAFVLLIGAELLRGTRVRTRALGLMAAGTAVLLVVNVPNLTAGADALTGNADVNRAELGALELARGVVEPLFQPEPGESRLVQGHLLGRLRARFYFAAVDELGSPAYSPAQIAHAPPQARTAADLVLAAALRLAPRPGARVRAGPSPPSVAPGGAGATATAADGCLRLRPAASAPATFVLVIPRRGVLLKIAQPSAVDLALRRFAPNFVVTERVPPGPTTTVLAIPPDRAPRPWLARLGNLRGPVVACGIAPS